MTYNNTSLFQRILTVCFFIIYLNIFFFQSIGATGFVFIAIGTFIFISKILKQSFSKYEFISTGGLFLALSTFSLGLILRANNFVTIILSLGVVLILLVQGYVLSSHIPMVRSLFELLLAPVYFGLDYIKNGFRMLAIVIKGNYSQILPQKQEDKKQGTKKSLFLGFIIGLFVIGLLISMLSNADPIFASFIEKIVSETFLKSITTRVIYSSIIAILLSPFIILKRDSAFNSPIELVKRWNFVDGMSVVMGLVALVLGIFLIIQWPYVFVNVPFETDLSQFGVATYSEYVRKGFMELLRISLFVYGLLWIGLIFLREYRKKSKSILPYIQTVVLVEFFIFIISIFRRVWLYQQYHGWTIVRIYGSIFLLWVCGITIFLVARHYWEKRWVIGEIVLTVLVLSFLGIFNAEHFIITNHPPTVNKKVDYVYLSRMSADGYEGWVSSFNNAQKTINTYSMKESLLLREERKEIAYAGMVAKELSQQYVDLIQTYGTEEEKKQYLLQILNLNKNATIQVLENNTDPSLINNYKGHLDYIISEENNIRSGLYNSDTIFKNLRIVNRPLDFQYEMSSFDALSAYSFYDVYLLGNSTGEKVNYKNNEQSEIERLLVWNKSRKIAYEAMKNDISANKLLDLQTKYFNLERRIRLQPENERSYDMDISLDSPLVD